METNDHQAASDTSDVSNSSNTQRFAFDCEPLEISSLNSSHDNYLRTNIGEPLSCALVSAIIYRPEDPIEFIANCLVQWSRNKKRQDLIDQETNEHLMSAERYREQCLLLEQQQEEAKRSLVGRKEKQQKELVLEYDRHLLTWYQWDCSIDPRTDDEREPSTYFQEQKQHNDQQVQRGHARQFIHTHETASGFDNEMDNNESAISHDDGRLSFAYFSKLKDKLITCDDS